TTTSGHKFVYSITYGRSAKISEAAKDGRIDVAVNYEDTRAARTTDNVELGLPNRVIALETAASTVPPRDRFVASIAYTYKMTDNFSFPISLVYANHAAFLGDVTRKLNAHFGLVYKLPS